MGDATEKGYGCDSSPGNCNVACLSGKVAIKRPGVVPVGTGQTYTPLARHGSPDGERLKSLILAPQVTSCRSAKTLFNRAPPGHPISEPPLKVCLDRTLKRALCKVFSIGINYQWDFDD